MFLKILFVYWVSEWVREWVGVWEWSEDEMEGAG